MKAILVLSAALLVPMVNADTPAQHAQQAQDRNDALIRDPRNDDISRDPAGLFYPAVQAANPALDLLPYTPSVLGVEQSIMDNLKPPALTLAPSAPSLAKTTWTGTERALQSVGRLGFAFPADGTAWMYDLNSRGNDVSTFDKGHWMQKGDQVDITFTNYVYHGRISKGLLSGTAQLLEGKRSVWSFEVRMSQSGP